ncbi:hypothetical protein [Hubei Wuhan insect virus 9]|uniref:hypothetical protein n=1 Tax=Hubei Wuhan insect virus 9 TaxID=1922833 RepID=UPI00090B33D3|nr:hypothetical protein [Hubei Wuhan insect virus 9]APG77670.1 hypothetical protein [Hubei Wuhan insect virus 9]
MPKFQKSITFVNKKYKKQNALPMRPRRSRSRTPSVRRNRSRSRSRTPKRTTIKYGVVDGFINRIMNKLSSILVDPYTYIGLALMSSLMYIHYFHIDDSAVNSIVKTLKKNDATKAFAEWVDGNINKIFAIIMLLYHSLQIPIKYRYFTVLLSMITVFLMPSLSIVTYSATIFGVVMYHKMKKRTDKFIILLFYVAIMSWFYYDEIIKYHSKTTRIKRETENEQV